MPSKRKYEIAMVLSMAGLYFFSFLQRVAVPGTVFNDIQSEFLCTASEVTRLSAIYLFVYATMQPFAGYLADRFGGIKVVLVSGVLLCTGSLLFPYSYGLWELYLSRALVGLGASTMYLCMIKETDHYFSGKNFAPVLGFLCLLGYSGGLAGTRPFRMLVDHIGWRMSCVSVAGATFAALLFAWFMMIKVGRDDVTRRRTHIMQSIGIVLKNKLNYPILITIPLCFSIYFSIQATIGAKFLEDICGISPLLSSNYTFAMMFFTISCMFLSGIISKLLGNKRKIFVIFNGTATMVAMIIFLLGIIYKLPPVLFFVPFILLGTASGCTPVNVSFVKEINPPDNVAVSVGILNTTVYVLVAITSQGIGKILDIFSNQAKIVEGATIYPHSAYITLFVILLSVSVIAFVASLFSSETYGENISNCSKI